MKFRLSDSGMLMEVKTLQRQRVNNVNHDFMLIDVNDIKETWEHIKSEWFGGTNSPKMVTGVFWAAFMGYIFPWLLDIAKVYCAFMVVQGFYREHQSGGKGDGKTGFQAMVHYGKWYLAFWLIPWSVELIDQIGRTMFDELSNNGS